MIIQKAKLLFLVFVLSCATVSAQENRPKKMTCELANRVAELSKKEKDILEKRAEYADQAMWVVLNFQYEGLIFLDKTNFEWMVKHNCLPI